MIGRLILGITLFLSALACLVWGGGAAAVCLILAVSYLVIAGLWVLISGRKLTLKLTDEGLAAKGEEVPVRLTIDNRSLIPISRIDAKVISRNRMTGEKTETFVSLTIPSRRKRSSDFRFLDRHCGRIEFLVDELRIADTFGIFRRRISEAASAQFLYTPVMEKLEIPTQFLDSYNMESYSYSQNTSGGDPGEVFGLKEYEDGDSLRLIHWKLSAKMSDMMVKIPALPVENNIIVILDNLTEEGYELDAEQKDGLMDLFFSVSYTLISQGVMHTLGWYDTYNNKFEFEEVSLQDDLWNIMGSVLGAGFAESKVSIAYRYMEALSEQRFSNHFVTTAGSERDLDRLEIYGAVKVFRK